MSCRPGEPCEEGKKRRAAMGVLGLMALIFMALSLMSFTDSRGQVVPTEVEYAGHDAVDGKRIFQAYNCMGCHTIVGNGAYFGPDLTKLYGAVGPAWLEAFLPSAGSWPTQTAVQVQLQKATVAAEADAVSIEAYFDRYPAAAESPSAQRSRHDHAQPAVSRGRSRQADRLPEIHLANGYRGLAAGAAGRRADLPAGHSNARRGGPGRSFGAARGSRAADLGDPVALGAQLVEDNGCTACHSAGTEKLVGPGWGGLYGSEAVLADGSKVAVDDAYLTRAIIDPDAQIATGFEAGVMPPYADILETDEVAAIVAYIHSLGGEGQ